MRPASPPRRDDDESDDDEEEEDEKVVDLEQRLESVETYASLTSSSAKDDAKNDDASKHSAKLFAKLARLRSALVESRPAGNAASSEGEKRGAGRRANEDGKNEIKRLHDRLESVLFQIAVVGNATFAKKCYSLLWSKRESDCERLFGLDVFAWKQVLSFAVASFFSLCVINTFSFVCLDIHPNRQSVFRFANELLNDIDDFPRRKSAFQGVVGENTAKLERFYGACDCVEALIWSFGKQLGTGQF